MIRTILMSAMILAAFSLPQRLGAQGTNDTEALKKEIELLKKENALLKKEIELLQKESGNKSTEENKTGDAKTNAKKVTLHGVEYEFISLKMDGTNGELIIAATNKSGKPVPFRVTAPVKLTTAQGKQYRSGVSPTGRMWELQHDVRVEIPMKMGEIPSTMPVFSSITIEVVDGKGFAEARKNPLLLKGEFKVER